MPAPSPLPTLNLSSTLLKIAKYELQIAAELVIKDGEVK